MGVTGSIVNGRRKLVWAGATRAVWAMGTTSGTATPLPPSGILQASCVDIDHHIRFMAPGSAGYNTGFEIGIFDDTGTKKLGIRRIDFGVYESFAAMAGASRSTTVALASGLPFTLRVEFRGVQIIAKVEHASGTVTLTHQNTSGLYAGYFNMGVVSDVDGAECIIDNVQTLLETQTQANNIIPAIAQGTVFASYGGGGWVTIGERIMPGTGRVAMADYRGKVYSIGGGKIFETDLVERTSTLFTANFGSLPGQTVGQPGSTDAEHIAFTTNTMLLARENELWSSAEDDIRDWDTGSTEIGGAFVIAFNEKIRGIKVDHEGRVIVSLGNSYKIVQGSRVLGSLDVRTMGPDVGASGPDSMLNTMGQTTLVHTGAGLLSIAEGAAANISAGRLRQLISMPPADREDRSIILARDPLLSETYLFRTRIDGAVTDHVVYDEVGDRFFVDRYPTDMSPTAVTVIDTRLVMGCEDGYLRFLDPEETDDDGEHLDWYAHLSVLKQPGLSGAVKLNDIKFALGRDSDPIKFCVFGGRDVESAFDNRYRASLFTESYDRGDGFTPVNVTHRVLVVRVSPRYEGGKGTIEYAEGRVGSMPSYPDEDPDLATVPATPCTQPTGATTTAPVGACCVPIGGADYECRLLSQAACLSLGGTWHGAGTTCSSSECETDPPPPPPPPPPPTGTTATAEEIPPILADQ